MVNIYRHTAAFRAALLLGLALSAAATPSFAQRSEAGDARARAVEECSRAASQYKQTTWGAQELTVYRACMGQHGHAE